MKKVGTQVELDLTKVLKMLDKAFVALEKQSKVWDDWLNVVRKALPTMSSVEAALGKVIGRLNQLKFTSEGATEAGKEEMAVRRRQITVLRAVRDEYREQGKAAEKAARAAEQGAKKEVAAANAAARAQDRHTKATGRGLKKMLLWGIGAASAYRLYIKLRRAAAEFTAEVIKDTAEQERLIAVNKQLRATMAAAFSPAILESIEYISSAVEKITGYMTDLAVQLEVNRRAMDAAAESTNTQAQYLMLMGGEAQIVAEITGLNTNAQIAYAEALEAATTGTDTQAQYLMLMGGNARIVAEVTGVNIDNQDLYADALDAVNGRIDDFNAKTEEQVKLSKEVTGKMDEARRALEKYRKALYQITERGLTDMLQAQRDYYDNVTELELDRQRQAEDDAIAAARRLEDIHLDFARRLAALEEKLDDRMFKLKKKFDKRKRRAAEMLADKLLSIERKYQDKLLDIERTYSRSMYEAIATRDATAALQAMRRRKEDIVDANRDRDRARADAFRDYRRRIRDLQESLKEQERIARESYEDQLEELLLWLAQQEEDHRISLRRREEDAALSYARSLQDLKDAFGDRLLAISAQNTLERANAKADYILREDAYANHLARMAAIWQSYQTATTSSSGSSTVVPIHYPVELAKGGMMIVNRPTLAMFGEGGRPELVIAQPLSATSHAHNITGSVTHQINATIQQSIAGMEGRIAGAVHQALADVIH